MKKVFMFALLMLFAVTTSAFSAGEGIALGTAWANLNAVCNTIADKDDSGNYAWSKDKIKEVGAEAKKSLANVQSEVTALENDEDAQAVEGKNSVKSLKKLLKHALKAIDDLSKDTESDD